VKKVLIANRGEIACRIIKSCRSLGLETVAVYSQADEGALHVQRADSSAFIGNSAAKESYLVADKVIAAAQMTGADAIHPGYGFLAENPRFARQVEDSGLTWIGPRPHTIEDMGDKERARDIARSAGVPVLPGSPRFSPGDLDGIEAAAEEVGYPLLVKATAGGGGIGMKRLDDPTSLREVVEATQSMAEKSFGDGTIYLERLVAKARHVEIQIFGYGDGHAVHLFERDCSVQRRFQKVLEESPSPGLPDVIRQKMATAAVSLAHHARYRGAGTVEFIVDAETFDFFFLEMNTRIQVEHPVTEMATGLDLVGMQLRQARGDLEPIEQRDISHRGHAIECRVYAENPDMNFIPSPGVLQRFDLPAEDSRLRIDSGFQEGDKITFYYDPMLAKVIARGDTRAEAVERMGQALGVFRVEGVKTNIPFLLKVMDHPAFQAGDLHTRFIDEHKAQLVGP
jgi:acetyl/propionyl-CoA carboxylase alpha subunit